MSPDHDQAATCLTVVGPGSRFASPGMTMIAPRSNLPHHLAAKTVDLALARERHQRDLAGGAGLEADSRAGGDVEAHAARLVALEAQRRVGLEEVVVAADLDRPVAG